MRASKLGAAAGLAAIGLTTSAVIAHAQYDDARAPRISVSTAYGGGVSSNYVEPAISLSEDAYVFAISVDLDGTIRVLQPEYPGIVVRMNSRRDLHLPRFFAGFGERQRTADRRYGGYASSYYDSYDPGYSDARGTIIALASRRPFNLGAVTVGGDWDMHAIERILGGRNPYSAAGALAQRLGVRGEPIGRDFYRFGGGAHYYTSLYNTASYGCHPFYGALGFSSGISVFRAAQLRRAGYTVGFAGFDACGQPRYFVHSKGVVTGPPRPPAAGAFPRSRTPSNVPRNPGRQRPGSAGTSTRATDDFPDRRSRRTPPPDRVSGRQPAPDRAQPARGSFPSDRGRATSAEPRQRAEPVRSSPPPERAQPRERPAPAREASTGADRPKPAS